MLLLAPISQSSMKPLLEHIDPGPDAGLQLFRREDAAFGFHWHHHRAYELTLITRSAGRRLVGDSVEAYGPGDLVLLGPMLPHTWHSQEATPGPHTAVVAQFHAEAVGPWPEAEPVRRLLSRAACGLRFDGPGVPALRQAFAALPVARGLSRITGLLAVLDRLATDASIERIAMSTAVIPPNDAPLDDRVGEVLRRMAERFTQDISQADEAARLGMTPAGFARLFKRSVGKRFTQTLHELRVAEACRLLRESADPITAVALASGFNNLSNFNRVFHRLKGVTPRAYRAMGTAR